jgi:primosomal protein N' (replication factor Y)
MFARVIVDLPIEQPLDYALPPGSSASVPGQLCVVPLGRRSSAGICVDIADSSELGADRIKPVSRWVEEVEPLGADWLRLTRFAADYYQHAWGEVALPALPPLLRAPPGPRFTSVIARLLAEPQIPEVDKESQSFLPSKEQEHAIDRISGRAGFAPIVLFGVTGSGKTVVYLEAIARALDRDPSAQCLLLVPEINLTPQLRAQVSGRLPHVPVVHMHSGMADRERAGAWLAAHQGRARIVIGTRLAVFASIPSLRLIVVDEEQDASYKAGDGVRFSARDLAVKRAQLQGIPVVLGSATPSLETWAHVQAGRYELLRLTQRVEARPLPEIELVDTSRSTVAGGISSELERALTATSNCGEQSLVFINRRGYAPVLTCAACGWTSNCGRCSVFAALHKSDSTLRCHHCGWQAKVPRACPTCGNQDLQPIGQGTQRIEESLRRLLPDASIARIDRDSTRRRGTAESAFAAVHAGATDVLVGTQMVAKGHDFQRVALVGVLNVDPQLVSPDFRAPERLFATLMQVAGRAGRAGASSRVLVQTRFPRHPLLSALARHDYEGFAHSQLTERQAAGMPPYVSQALLVAEARQLDAALRFLAQARLIVPRSGYRTAVYDPVPMPVAKLDRLFRAQLLVEARRRGELQSFLRAWLPDVRVYAKQHKPRVRWRIEVDPLEI